MKQDSPPYLLVGVTGNIGSGKSVFCKGLEERGAFRIDADQLAREVVQPGAKGLQEIREQFGEACLLPDGTLNRAHLGQIVFTTPSERERLEEILHPRIRERAIEKCKEAIADGYQFIVYEAALLLEGNHHGFVDRIIVIYADRDTRLNRVAARDQLTREAIVARMNTQMNWEEQVTHADLSVPNNGTPEDLTVLCDQAMDTLKDWLKDKYP